MHSNVVLAYIMQASRSMHVCTLLCACTYVHAYIRMCVHVYACMQEKEASISVWKCSPEGFKQVDCISLVLQGEQSYSLHAVTVQCV